MSQERMCSVCGRAAGVDARFCSQCGASLAESGDLRRYTRASLDEMFAHLRSGEQRPAAILMTDVSGFTHLGEDVEPEWLFHLINEVFEELAECLLAHGAHIDKYVGDEVVALFGVPVAQERSAERAILAALAMRDRLRLLNQQGRFSGANLEIHTGINVGRVMVGPVGHRAYAEYTVIGDAVNVAKRLEDEAPAGEIYVSRAVCDAVGEAFELDAIPPLTLDGRRHEVEVFRVVRARAVPLQAAREMPGEAGRTIVRAPELQQLTQWSEQAKCGSQVTLCVEGPPGIGKSRLLADWRQSARTQGLRFAWTSCHACGEHFPFLSVADVVAQLTGLHLEGWPPRVAGDAARATKGIPVGQDTCGRLAAVLHSLGAAPEEADWEWAAELPDALVELLSHAAGERPLCLVVEDVQWIDESSREVFTDVFSRGLSWPLMAAFSAREPLPEWLTGDLRQHTLRLEPFSRANMERLIAAWAAPEVLPASTVRAIANRADGHPHFARELVHSIRRRATDLLATDASLPGTLEELFLAELDRLPIPLRRLVQAASVLGEPLSPHLLEAVVADETPLTESLLWQATEQGLLQAAPAPGQFVFRRRLLFEVAYATIPPSQRKDLHARIATHLVSEVENSARPAVHAAAHHAYLGYGDERAIDPLLRSARQYRLQYANRQAIQAASRAIEIIASVPDPDRLTPQRLAALLALAQSYQVVGDLGQAEGAIAEAELLTDDCDDEELVANIMTSAATLRWMQGNTSQAEERFTRAFELWERRGNETRAAQAQVGMGLCADQRGDRERAVECFSQAARRSGAEPWARAAALNNLGVILLEEGRYAEAEPYLIEGARANEEATDRRGAAQSSCSLGELYYRLARFAEAERWLDEARSEAAEIEDPECVMLADAYATRIRTMQGQPPGPPDASAEAAVAVSAEYPAAKAIFRLAQTEAMLLTGTAEQARVALEELCTGGEPSIRGRPAAACGNAAVEGLCAAAEAATMRGETAIARRIAPTLIRQVEGATDRQLRRYAAWLLHTISGHNRTPAPMPAAQSGEHTVFDLRSRRLVDFLNP